MGYATDWPTSLRKPTSCDFWLEEVGAAAQSPYDGSEQWTPRYSQWRAVLEWATLTVPQMLAIKGFFMLGRGRQIELNIPNFTLSGKVGTKTGSVTVNGSHSAGATTLAITGGSGVFAAGDVIHLSYLTHDRLHQVVGGNGTTAVDIAPGLWWDQAGGSTVFHRGVVSVLNMRETMLTAAPLQGASIFPSPGTSAGTSGLVAAGWAVELVSSHRTPL